MADVKRRARGVFDQVGRTGDAEQNEAQAVEFGFGGAFVLAGADGGEKIVGERQFDGRVDLVNEDDYAPNCFGQGDVAEEFGQALESGRVFTLAPPVVEFGLEVEASRDRAGHAFVPPVSRRFFVFVALARADAGQVNDCGVDSDLFQTPGGARHTEFLLRYLSDLDLRRVIQVAMNKSEQFNQFTQWVGFGGKGIITENDRAEQRKRIKHNHLVAKCLIFHNVYGMTGVLRGLLREGAVVKEGTLRHLSPYHTEHINRFGVYEWNPQRISSPINYDLEILPALFR